MIHVCIKSHVTLYGDYSQIGGLPFSDRIGFSFSLYSGYYIRLFKHHAIINDTFIGMMKIVLSFTSVAFIVMIASYPIPLNSVYIVTLSFID